MIERIFKKLQNDITNVISIEEYDKNNILKNYYSFTDFDILNMFLEEIIALYKYNVGFQENIIEINCFKKSNNEEIKYSDKIIIITIKNNIKIKYSNI